MADKPGSFRDSPRVSRHTIVVRKAKDEDARRLDEEEEARVRSGGQTRVLSSQRRNAGEESAGAGESRILSRDRVVSGKTVVVRREDGGVSGSRVSARLSGRQASSVRVAGGDTIIRYQSGDMVIKRGARQAELRRQAVWGYAFGYLALFALYGYFLLTGTYTMTAHEFLDKAFAKRRGVTVVDLELAAFQAMRGNRTPAEVRMAESLSFYDENKDLVGIASGDRLTLLTAAKLGKAILDDEKKPEAQRSFSKPLRLYHETYLSNIDWPHLLTLYNALGFFLLLILFLWQPIAHYLGTQGKKTAVALRNARKAQDEAAEYRHKYRDLAKDIEARTEHLRAEAESRAAEDREAALADARRQADAIRFGIDAALENEAVEVRARLGVQAAVKACEEARKILAERLGQREHDLAVDELIADVKGMRFEEG